MKQLHKLAKELKENNFQMTDSIKDHFEEFLSIIAEGSRILHPRFGLGTVKRTMGNSWVIVEFDKEIEEWENRNEMAKANTGFWPYRRPEKHVMISSCISIHMLIKKELNK